MGFEITGKWRMCQIISTASQKPLFYLGQTQLGFDINTFCASHTQNIRLYIRLTVLWVCLGFCFNL